MLSINKVLEDRGDEFRSLHYARTVIPLVGVFFALLHLYSVSKAYAITQPTDVYVIIPDVLATHAAFTVIYVLLLAAYAAFCRPHVDSLSRAERGIINTFNVVQQETWGFVGLTFMVISAVALIIMLPVMGEVMMSMSMEYRTLNYDLSKTELHRVMSMWMFGAGACLIAIIGGFLFIRLPDLSNDVIKGRVQTLFLHAISVLFFWSLLEQQWVQVLLNTPDYQMGSVMKVSLMLGVIMSASYLQRAIGRMTGFTRKYKVNALILTIWLGVGLIVFLVNNAFDTSLQNVDKQRIDTTSSIEINGTEHFYVQGSDRYPGNGLEEIFIETYAGDRHWLYDRASRTFVVASSDESEHHIDVLSQVLISQTKHWKVKANAKNQSASGPIFAHALDDYIKTSSVDKVGSFAALNSMMNALSDKEYQRFADLYSVTILNSDKDEELPAWLIRDMRLIVSLILISGKADIHLDSAKNVIQRRAISHLITHFVRVYRYESNEKLEHFKSRINQIFAPQANA